MAYRAEIEIGVKGAKKLEQAFKQITELSKSIDNTNKRTIFGTKQVANLNEYARAVEKARRNLNKTRIQLDDAGNATKTYKKAIDQFVSALGASNQAQKITNDLVEKEIGARTRATAALKAYNAAAAPARQVGSMAGAYLRPGESRLRGQTSAINPQAAVEAEKDIQTVRENLQKLDEASIRAHNARLNLQADYLVVLQRTADAAKFRAQQPTAQLALPAFQERGLQLLDDSVKANESQLRIEQALNGERARGVRFLEKQSQEEKRQLDLGITGQRTNLLPANALRQEQDLAIAAAKRTEQLAVAQRLQRENLAVADRIRNVAASTVTQVNLRLNVLQQIAAIGRQINQSTKQELVNQRRLNRELAVRRGRDRQRRIREGISSGIIGGAFPLLFGQGGGAAFGGALGGLGGGLLGGQFGFGLSLVGTQLGAIFDQTIANAQKTGQALNSTGSALDFMREKSLFSTAAAKERAAVLEEQGRVEELATLLTEELVDKIGNKGVESLQSLGKETDETTRLWAELTSQLQALISGPLKGFLTIVNSVLRGVTTAGRFKALEEDFAGNAAFEAAVLEARKKGGRKGAAASLGPVQTKDQIALLERAAAGEFGARPITATIPVTPEDERRFAVKDTAGDKAAREAARIDARIEKLRLERQEIARITEFKDKIAAAEAVQDKLLVRRLQGEQNVFKIQQEGLEKLVGVKTEREREAIQLTTNAKITAANRDTERDITEILRQRNELYTNTVQNLQSQLDIATATTREEAEQLRLEQELQTLRESNNFSEPQLRQIAALKQSLVESQQPLNQFITESTKSLNDLEQVAVTVSEGIGQAFGQAMTVGLDELVSGTKSAQEVFADFLKNIANLLLQVAGQMIATYVAIGVARTFAGVPASSGTGSAVNTIQDGSAFNLPGNIISLGGPDFAANGGPVKSGSPYIIGERGPELFVPRSNGRIVPNGRFGGGSGGDVSVVVNVDAKGSSAEGNQPNAKALGSAIGAAVQSEIIKQKRPGGLLA